MNEEIAEPDEILDATGLLCPEPMMLVHNKIRDLQAGGLLKVIATDPSSQRDITKFCHFLGHQLVAQQQSESSYIYWIRKKQLD